MTHSLLRRLASRGHEVTVAVRRPQGAHWTFEGITVTDSVTEANVAVYHPDWPESVDSLECPLVEICHNDRIGVQLGLYNTEPNLITVNSAAMQATFGGIVVHPPTPPIDPVSGGMVGLINLERTSKVGPFWDVAKAMRSTPFLGVRGGYGRQDIRRRVNVTVIETVPASRMRDEVWARLRILLVPSASESWSMVASEAMAHGVPVVAHPLPGVLENLGLAGVWADRAQPTEWVAAIEQVLADWDAHSALALARAQEQIDAHEVEAEAWCDAVEALV